MIEWLPILVMFVVAVGFALVSLGASYLLSPIKATPEIIFLLAWATRFNDLGWYGILAISIFTFFVLETLYYVWKKGVLDWNIPRRERYLKQDINKEAA